MNSIFIFLLTLIYLLSCTLSAQESDTEPTKVIRGFHWIRVSENNPLYIKPTSVYIYSSFALKTQLENDTVKNILQIIQEHTKLNTDSINDDNEADCIRIVNQQLSKNNLKYQLVRISPLLLIVQMKNKLNHIVIDKLWKKYTQIENNKNNLIEKKDGSKKVLLFKSNILQKKDTLWVDLWHITTKDSTKKTYVESLNKSDFFVLMNDSKRISKNYKYRSWEAGMLTIPFKARFGYKADSADVKERKIVGRVTLNPNTYFYFGRKWGREYFYTRRYEPKQNTKRLISAGVLGGFFTVDIDNDNTESKETELSKTSFTALGLTGGLGLFFTGNIISVGIMCGWDFMLGKEAQKWDFAANNSENKNRYLPWVGVGLGIKLNVLSAGE